MFSDRLLNTQHSTVEKRGNLIMKLIIFIKKNVQMNPCFFMSLFVSYCFGPDD